MQDVFHVRPVWDNEVSRWYSKSDIRGLAIETDTLEEFEELVAEFAGELIVANHLSDEDVAEVRRCKRIPVVIYERPRQAD